MAIIRYADRVDQGSALITMAEGARLLAPERRWTDWRHLWLAQGVALLFLLAACAKPSVVTVPPPRPVLVGYEETGTASWYGEPYHGRRTASGEVYDMAQMTAAHRTPPFGTWGLGESLRGGPGAGGGGGARGARGARRGPRPAALARARRPLRDARRGRRRRRAPGRRGLRRAGHRGGAARAGPGRAGGRGTGGGGGG